ncbi:MAG: hypothetical protein VKK59_04040 [Vampirovibrionales bacterium]|nr:hypothetical protein [Vampirovibrionales bacterium]
MAAFADINKLGEWKYIFFDIEPRKRLQMGAFVKSLRLISNSLPDGSKLLIGLKKDNKQSRTVPTFLVYLMTNDSRIQCITRFTPNKPKTQLKSAGLEALLQTAIKCIPREFAPNFVALHLTPAVSFSRAFEVKKKK